MNYKEEFVKFMMDAGVLTFGNFTLKSGRSSPYFVNAGKYNTGMQISRLGDFYADSIIASGEEFDFLYGPAYKGIPLCVSAVSALYKNHGRDMPYTFNRKEAKDHGEGGILVGHTPKDGERAAIIDDVSTAGTAVRESFKVLGGAANVRVTAFFVSIDRMEKGTGSRSALDELRDEFGIAIYPIVTIREVISFLKGTFDNEMILKMEAYLSEYASRTE